MLSKIQESEHLTLAIALRFVEFENAADLRTAVEKLDGRDFKGSPVVCLADVSGAPGATSVEKLCVS